MRGQETISPLLQKGKIMSKKMTARELAEMVIKENRPFDYSWLRYIKRTYTTRELAEWAKSNIEMFTTGEESKQLIGRAATILKDEVMAEVW